MNYLHENYLAAVEKIRSVDIEDLKYYKINMQESLFQLKTIIFARSKSLEKEISELQTRNAINIHSIMHSKEESIHDLRRNMYHRLESQWQQLNDTITSYELSTETKLKLYEHLREQDDAHQREAARFPAVYAQLRDSADSWRRNLLALGQERDENAEMLRLQADLLSKRLNKARHEDKVARGMDVAQLRRLSVLSSDVIKTLERILRKGEEILTMARLCSDLEPVSLKVKKYSLRHLDESRELMKPSDEPFGFLRKVEGFRNNVCCIKEENVILRRRRSNLIEENNRLRHYLKTYLMSVSRMPTIRPKTRA